MENKTCSFCNQEFGTDKPACPYCGREVQSFHCSICENLVAGNANRCPSCGNQIKPVIPFYCNFLMAGFLSLTILFLILTMLTIPCYPLAMLSSWGLLLSLVFSLVRKRS